MRRVAAIHRIVFFFYLRATISWVLMLKLNVSVAVLRCRFTFRSFICNYYCEFANMCFESRAQRQSGDVERCDGDKSKWKHKQNCINTHFDAREQAHPQLWSDNEQLNVVAAAQTPNARAQSDENTDMLLKENRTANISKRNFVVVLFSTQTCASVLATGRARAAHHYVWVANGPCENNGT